MSGGSYEYLCYALDLGDLLEKTRVLEEMADRLAGLGYASDAALETMSLLLTLRQMDTWAEAYLHRLSGVWKAVEWWDSMDWGEDQLKQALNEYRMPKP